MTKERLHYVLLNYACEQLKDDNCPLKEDDWVILLNCYTSKKSSNYCKEKLNKKDINVDMWYTRISMALAMDALTM